MYVFANVQALLPYAPFLHLQFENGLREIGPRKDRNAAPLRDGKTNSFFQAYLADVGNCGFPPSNYCLVTPTTKKKTEKKKHLSINPLFLLFFCKQFSSFKLTAA